ncbi:hypothetical protein [Aquimarina sp. MMG016]|uniref:hypothetical protein n=1 Tax=Aquimarina sp. MMG016 TaxID=2822690 RepID=UPI001B3A2DA7|nr:hypothetical protein [Aquimarina sp. MMG016]MBQ4819907.1 hypothetical protein [Aquimarina sp. MMG016]
MKSYPKLVVLLIAVTLVTATSFAQSDYCPKQKPLDLKEAVGEWKGSFTYNGDLKKVTFYIAEEDGKLLSEVSIPGMSAKKLTAFTKICCGSEIKIEVVVDNKKFDFCGKPKEGKMAGRLVSRDVKDNSSKEVFTVKRV